MSAAAINGGDAVKPNPTAASGPKQSLKSTNTGKTLEGTRAQAASPVDGQNRKQHPHKQAWVPGQPNPITQQRASSSTPNGTERIHPKSSPSQPQANSHQSKSLGDSQADKHAHDRTVFLLAQFIGKDATITLKNGEQFSGVFSGGSLEAPKTQYTLKMTKRTILPSHQQVNGDVDLPQELAGEGDDHVMSFDIHDTADLYVEGVNTSTANAYHNGSISGSFRTDTEISAREAQMQMQRERELQPWNAGPDESIEMSLDASGSADWDQFATNERMYGVQSTYDENIYTTAIDRSNPAYRRREAEADRIAREIEGSTPANAHVAEERRRDAIKDTAEDEEEKYSGVRRDTALPRRAVGAYVPPSQRPITNAPTVPGAPFDPAIISAQLTKPATSPVPSADRAANASPAQVVSTEDPAQAVLPKPSKELAASAATVTVPVKKKDNTTEDRVRDTADAFKQFANNEKLKIRQAQEIKKSNLRQEKNVKLNDLKKFAANFKLKSRVPDDLVPILAKDRDKQMEIQAKAEEAAKEEEIKAKERLSDKASNATSPAPSAASTQPGPASAVEQRNTFNHRVRPSQQSRQAPAMSGQLMSPRLPLGQRIHNNQALYGRLGAPQPAELRIPSGGPPHPDMPMSPSSATRLNVNAFEFRPGANSFTPTGTSPSPNRSTGSGMGEAVVPFLDKSKETKAFSSSHDPLKRMAETDYDEISKKKFTPNGGLPQAYNTPPTWPCPKERESASYLSLWPQQTSQAPSPMHTPNPNVQMPHAHQLPLHMQQGHPMAAPAQRSQFFQQHNHAPSFDPRMQQFGPNGSVQNSPRAPQQIPVGPFNAQMPPMPVSQFPGQQMPAYGMSPSVQYRQPAMQGGPMMMMMPGQQHGQMGPMQPGYPQGGPQFRVPQMGGHMMVQQHSSGGYVNGPMSQPGFPSPMPPHAQPHMNHMPQHGAPAGFAGSPRPPMMQHQGSHQGFQPGMPMQPHFAPSPGQGPHPYHLQQRAMSGGYPQMTPRQQHAVPNHPSPGMAMGQGDEGK